MIDYEKKYDLKERHDTLLQIICEFDRICRKNGVHYSLGFGTLLGSVRHSGFIPWDDDADVIMTRDEYKKLLAVDSENGNLKIVKTTFLDRITIISNNPHQYYVDLFLLDRMPKSKIGYQYKVFITKLLRCYFINKKQLERAKKKSGIKRYISIFGLYCLIGVGKIEKIIFKKRDITAYHDRKIETPLKKSNGMMKLMTTSLQGLWFSCPERWFEKYEDVCFSGKKLMRTSAYDDLLKYQYHDYFMLPPEEKRKPNSHLSLEDDETAAKYSKIVKEI